MLLVVADGPRFPEEEEKCEQARGFIKRVDWNCEVLTNFSDNNLGCGRRISSGIEWVFSKVDEAIPDTFDLIQTQGVDYSSIPFWQTEELAAAIKAAAKVVFATFG